MNQTNKQTVLSVQNLTKTFGAVFAAKDISLKFLAHETVCFIGANGAGKTTFVNMVTGHVKPSKGRIQYFGRDITGIPPNKLTRAGLCRSFQMPQIFMSMSVYENILLSVGIAESGRLPAFRRLDNPKWAKRTEELLKYFSLIEHRNQQVDLLSQGIRKLVDIAMATAGKPKLLLLDEPTSGISSEEKFDIMEIIMNALKEENITVLFVEHDMDIVSRYSERLIAFYNGSIIADDKTEQALADNNVKEYVIGSEPGEDKVKAAENPGVA